jgi:hypothetical protein
MVVTSVSHITPYGGWDAWAIWNLQAKYLANGHYWQNLFLNTRHGHPDYPLLLPGISAMVSRALPGIPVEVTSFYWGMLVAMIIPVMLWLVLKPKSTLVAIWAIYSLLSSQYYLSQSVAMYADMTLGCFLLGAIVALRQIPEGSNRVLLVALCLGGCLWTKNEGAILVALFIVFHLRQLLGQKRWIIFFAGISMPLIALCMLKSVYAPANDMVNGFSMATLQQATDWQRYETIWNHVSKVVTADFGYMRWVVVLYLLVCLFRKQWPTATAWMLASSMVVYFFVYVFSPMELHWHLVTSADRLMLQLMPALLYVLIDDGFGNKTVIPQNIFFSRFGMNV